MDTSQVDPLERDVNGLQFDLRELTSDFRVLSTQVGHALADISSHDKTLDAHQAGLEAVEGILQGVRTALGAHWTTIQIILQRVQRLEAQQSALSKQYLILTNDVAFLKRQAESNE